MGHLLGLFSYLMWWNLGRRKPIPKDCLTLTACCEFSKIPPPRKLVLKYKYVGLFHTRDIWAETCFLMTGIPRRPHCLPKLPPPSSSQPDPLLPPPSPVTMSCPYLVWKVSINRTCFSSLGNWPLTHFQSACLPWLRRCPRSNHVWMKCVWVGVSWLPQQKY